MSSKSNRRTLHSIRRGLTIVEGAIVLPVMLLFIFAGLDLGIAVTRYNGLSEAACRAARCAAVHGANAGAHGVLGPVSMTFTADQANTIADSCRFVLPTMNPAEVNVMVEWPDGTNQYDDRVQVTLRYQHQPVLPVFFGFGTINMQATSVMAVDH